MISSKFKRLKTLDPTDDDRNRPIATFTTTSSPAEIPHLPDNVIVHILSFFPIKLAARATAVSKLWASLWPSFSVIDFDEGDPDIDDLTKFRRFLQFLENCIQRCKNQRSLNKLRLRIVHCLDEDDSDTFDKCLTFALERRVKELELCFVEGFYQVPQEVLYSRFLTSLILDNVRVHFRSRDTDNNPLTLVTLKTMILKDVEIDNLGLQILLTEEHVPALEHLVLDLFVLGGINPKRCLMISNASLKSLEVMNCDYFHFEVACHNLETFMFVSQCIYNHHGDLTIWKCANLKQLYISTVGMERLSLFGCRKSMENAIFTPSLVYFRFSGVVEAMVHFMETPSGLLEATFRIHNDQWTSEYYSLLRDCLECFDCTGKLQINIHDAEGVIIPENCRREWSPPLPRVKQLQLTVTVPQTEGDYRLDPSLTWIAPSAEILPHRYNSKALLI